jgi:hypothetical protein
MKVILHCPTSNTVRNRPVIKEDVLDHFDDDLRICKKKQKKYSLNRYDEEFVYVSKKDVAL